MIELDLLTARILSASMVLFTSLAMLALARKGVGELAALQNRALESVTK